MALLPWILGGLLIFGGAANAEGDVEATEQLPAKQQVMMQKHDAGNGKMADMQEMMGEGQCMKSPEMKQKCTDMKKDNPEMKAKCAEMKKDNPEMKEKCAEMEKTMMKNKEGKPDDNTSAAKAHEGEHQHDVSLADKSALTEEHKH